MKRNSGHMSSNPSWGGGQSQVSPYSASNNMSPYSSGMSPYSSGSMVSQAGSNQLSPIVCPEQTVFKNFYHTASQPIVHPVNIVNQHHTIPVPQHFCAYSVKDVNCGMRGKRRR